MFYYPYRIFIRMDDLLVTYDTLFISKVAQVTFSKKIKFVIRLITILRDIFILK